MRRAVLLVLLLGLSAVAGAPAIAAEEQPAFDWEMPPRLVDRDGDGLVDYAGAADEVPGGPFEVRLRVAPRLCNEDAEYRWTLPGRQVDAGRGACVLTHQFEREGTFDVRLDVSGATGTQSFTREVIVQDWLVVALGDSVASGEGNPDRRGNLRKALWHSPRCHRSRAAGVVRAAVALEADPKTSTTFAHLACSGAKLSTGLLARYPGIDVPSGADPSQLPPQLDELHTIALGREVDAVIVSAGANDVHFGAIAEFCMTFKGCTTKRFDPETPDAIPPPGAADAIEDVVEAGLAEARQRYDEVATELPPGLAPARVLLVEYFDPTRNRDGEFCKRIGLPGRRIDRQEAQWAQERILTPLNGVLAAAANQHGWQLIPGVAEAFKAHGYCARGQRWIQTLLGSATGQRGESLKSRIVGTLHPNERGHSATAVLINGVLQRSLYEDDLPRKPDEEEDEDDDGRGPGNGPGPMDNGPGAAAEPVVAVILGGLIALGLIGLAVARWRRGRRGSVVDEPPLDPYSQWEPRPLSGGRELADLLLSAKHWVHRRVESIEFLDDRTTRRRMSIDFSPPPRPGHVPLALLRKGLLLERFDIVDEEGRSLPLLRREENSALGEACLLAVATDALGRPPPAEVAALCRATVQAGAADAGAVVGAWDRVAPRERALLRADERFVELQQTLTRSFPILVELAEPTRRRVLKLAYDEPTGGRPDLRARLGLAPLFVVADLPELGDSASHHLEFRRAAGVEAIDAQLVIQEPGAEEVRTTRQSGQRPQVHLYVGGVPRGTRGAAWVLLRAERTGLVYGGPMFALATALALTAGWFGLPGIAEESDNLAALLLAVPAALAAYLGAAQEHPIRRSMLLGIRALVLLCGLAAFVAAGALVLGLSILALRWVIGLSAAFAWLALVGLLATLVRPQPPP